MDQIYLDDLLVILNKLRRTENELSTEAILYNTALFDVEVEINKHIEKDKKKECSEWHNIEVD